MLTIDPNRNWDCEWGGAGASALPCSDTYRGTHAASQVEVQHVQKYLMDNKDVIKGYINFHSYSQLILYPWSYTCDEDYAMLEQVSADFAGAIKKTHHRATPYTWPVACLRTMHMERVVLPSRGWLSCVTQESTGSFFLPRKSFPQEKRSSMVLPQLRSTWMQI